MANVVKGRPAARRLDAAWLQAREDAARQLEDADARARGLLDVARREADGIRAAARRDGLEQGLAEATRQLADAAAARDRWLADAEAELARAAVEIARRVVGVAAEQHRDVALLQAGRALQAARDRARVVLRVHPDDLEDVRAAQPRLAALLPRAPGVALVSDEAVGRGGAVVETEAGRVDARLEPQLEALRAALEAAP